MPPLIRRRNRRGFTLIELLTVMFIIALLVAATLPALNSLKTPRLAASGSALVNLLDQGRQAALARNEPVEARFYLLPKENDASTASPSVYRGAQLYVLDKGVSTPLTNPLLFTSSVVCLNSTTTSNLFTKATAGTANPLPRVGAYGSNYTYCSFHFKPDGQTDLPVPPPTAAGAATADPSIFVTLVLATDPATDKGVPKNFFTVQIDPFTGRVRAFRP